MYNKVCTIYKLKKNYYILIVLLRFVIAEEGVRFLSLARFS